MPEFGPAISEFEDGARVQNVPVQVADATAHTTRDGKPYTRYVMRDNTGVINGIRWDHELAGEESGAVALVTGKVDSYRGAPQLKLDDLVVLPEPSAEILDRLRSDIDAGLRDRLIVVLRRVHAALPAVFWELFVEALGHDPFDTDAPFWVYAAAQSKHHHERGGLAWHVLTMLDLADTIAPHYPGLDVDLLRLAVLTHDLGKIDCYEMGPAGARQLSLDRTVGHTSYSMCRVHNAIAALRDRGREITAEDEEALLHCLAAHHGRIEWGAIREPVTPEAGALHALDMLDSQIRGGLDDRPAPPPDRSGNGDAAGRDPFAEEPDATEDPFAADDDDPFDEDGDQPSLF